MKKMKSPFFFHLFCFTCLKLIQAKQKNCKTEKVRTPLWDGGVYGLAQTSWGRSPRDHFKTIHGRKIFLFANTFINTNSPPGLDGIQPRLLKELKGALGTSFFSYSHSVSTTDKLQDG